MNKIGVFNSIVLVTHGVRIKCKISRAIPAFGHESSDKPGIVSLGKHEDLEKRRILSLTMKPPDSFQFLILIKYTFSDRQV